MHSGCPPPGPPFPPIVTCPAAAHPGLGLDVTSSERPALPDRLHPLLDPSHGVRLISLQAVMAVWPRLVYHCIPCRLICSRSPALSVVPGTFPCFLTFSERRPSGRGSGKQPSPGHLHLLFLKSFSQRRCGHSEPVPELAARVRILDPSLAASQRAPVSNLSVPQFPPSSTVVISQHSGCARPCSFSQGTSHRCSVSTC